MKKKFENPIKHLNKINKIIAYKKTEEIIKIINELASSDYPLEECYQDLIICTNHNAKILTELVEYMINSKDVNGLKIILENCALINKDTFGILIKNETCFGYIIRNINLFFPKLNDYCRCELIGRISETSTAKKYLFSQIKEGNIIKDVGFYSARELLNLLKESEEGLSIIRKNLQYLFKYEFRMTTLRSLMIDGMPERVFIENKKFLLGKARGEDLANYIEWLDKKGKFDEEDITLEQFIIQTYSKYRVNSTDASTLYYFYKELLSRQNLKLKDIKVLGKGLYSTVYKIGEYCVKVGTERNTPQIPYHRRILQPLIREYTNPNSEDGIFIELQNVVDKNWDRDLETDEINEKLYEIYKDLRGQGIIWPDIKKGNVGRLIKPNTPNYEIETLEGDLKNLESLHIEKREMDVPENITGIFNKKEEKPLQPGELVIIDTDLIFPIDKINYRRDLIRNKFNNLKYVEFEKRYRKELKMEKQKKYRER